ncbi:unnamed protein product [Ilex paraguariensis]|uniref:Pentatricopeptide repeat-containing protein n=1 Tax=Ilex paraguariensis TaxID=185542 RepID=A0ABC8V4I6_9AQUA
MAELGLIANQYTYTVLIDGLFKNGLKKDGFDLYEKMKLDGVLPDIFTYSSLINLYCNDGRDLSRDEGARGREIGGRVLQSWEDGQGFKFVQSAEVLWLSLVTYNALIAGFSRVGNPGRVVDLVREMEEKGISPSKVTYTISIVGI